MKIGLSSNLFVAMSVIGMLAVTPGIAASPRSDPGQDDWKAVSEVEAMDLPSSLPDSASGCLVVGFHVLRDGTVAKARVMQGAFTTDVPKVLQEEVTAVTIAAAERLRFRYVGREEVPEPAFDVRVIGFGPAVAGRRGRVRNGAGAQDERLRDACEPIDLAAWGEANAVAVEEAAKRGGQGLLVMTPDQPPSYWVPAGELRSPRYPLGAKEAGNNACVVVGYIIDVDGRTRDFRIMASRMQPPARQSSKAAFENAAVAMISTWRYAPGPDNLARLPEFHQVPVDFIWDSGSMDCRIVDLSETGKDGS